MKKLALALALVLVTVACGGSDDSGDGGTTATDSGSTTASTSAASSTPATTTATSSPTVEFTGDFCDVPENDAIVVGVDFFAPDLEQAINDWLAVIDAVEASAPSEIAADVAVIADAARAFAEVLADADYQMLNVDFEDPRLVAFNDGSLEEAGDNIADYCGWEDADVGGGDGFDPGIGGGGEFGGDEMPDTIPEVLVPPDVTGVFDNGAAGVNIGTDTSFADLLTQYTDVLGDPATDTGTSATFDGEVDGSMIFVIVDDLGDMRVVTILVLPG